MALTLNMTINVITSDHKTEKIIFDSIKPYIPEFKGIRFEHLKEKKTTLFDFEGYKKLELVVRADVKREYINADKVTNYIISKEKIWLANSDHSVEYFVILYFNDFWCRVFDLHKCDLRYENFTFTHKRTKERITQKVYKIPARAFAYEFWLDLTT